MCRCAGFIVAETVPCDSSLLFCCADLAVLCLSPSQYPDGYLEAQAAKQNKEGDVSMNGGEGSEDEGKGKGKRGKKRKAPSGEWSGPS